MNLEIPFSLAAILTQETVNRLRGTIRQAIDANHEEFAKVVSIDGSGVEVLPDRDGIDLITADSGLVRFRLTDGSAPESSVLFSINWRKGALVFDVPDGVISSEAQ